MGLTIRWSPIWLAGGVILLAHSAVIHAQTTVSGARVVADLSAGDGSAVVTVEYELMSADNVDFVELELLGFGSASTDEVTLAGGERLALRLLSGSRRGASLRLPPVVVGDPTRIALEYRVPAAVEERNGSVRSRIPIVTLSLPPATDSVEVFTATLRVPPGWRVTEGFPTSLREREPGVYVATLPVVPSVLSLRARTDGAWRLGAPLVADLLIALVMVAVALVGWRHLRAVSA